MGGAAAMLEEIAAEVGMTLETVAKAAGTTRPALLDELVAMEPAEAKRVLGRTIVFALENVDENQEVEAPWEETQVETQGETHGDVIPQPADDDDTVLGPADGMPDQPTNETELLDGLQISMDICRPPNSSVWLVG